MATKNFLFLLVSSFFIFGCASFKSRLNQTQDSVPSNRAVEAPAVGQEATDSSNIQGQPKEAQSTNMIPKIGVILGPGLVRSYAHVGVLQELHKNKIPISYVVGIEWGAIVGALYANRAQSYDVEWQLFKLKDVKSVNSFIVQTFSNTKADDFKIPFACPALNMNKQQTYYMSKSSVSMMLPFCLSSPPAIKPYQQNVAALADLKGSIDFLKNKGVNYIIYIHVLNSKNGILVDSIDSVENILWNITSQSLLKQSALVDHVIQVSSLEGKIDDFEKRREHFKRGTEAGQSASQTIIKKLGL
jgi:NTE family protein